MLVPLVTIIRHGDGPRTSTDTENQWIGREPMHGGTRVVPYTILEGDLFYISVQSGTECMFRGGS